MAAEALTDEDLPALYRAADQSSMEGQKQYRKGTAAILGSLLAAAVFGLVTTRFGPGSTDWGGVLAAVAFLASLVVQAALAQRRPERRWYEGRALAESAKSLGWQYAVAGGNYGRRVDGDDEVEGELRKDLAALLHDIGEADPFEVPPGAEQVSSAMRELRESELPNRKNAYRTGRVTSQRSWYGSKARSNRKRARIWSGATIACQVGGGAAAVLKATGSIEVDLLGVGAALAASIVAWVQLNSYAQLDEAYSLASHDLALVEARIGEPRDEPAWADFVADAEQAISREHRMWRAARATRLG
jgi:hypothetical protein